MELIFIELLKDGDYFWSTVIDFNKKKYEYFITEN